MGNDEQNEGMTRGMGRRALFVSAAGLLASAPAAASAQGHAAAPAPAKPADPGFDTISPPIYSDALMSVINLHEFEAVGRKNISELAYNYIRAGTADDLTLEANRAAFGEYWVRRRVMRDLTHIDTSVELFGRTYSHPIILGPVGLRRLMHPEGDRLTVLAAHKSEAILVGPHPDQIKALAKDGTVPVWWAASLGHPDKASAEKWVQENEALGASALCVSLDYPYTGLRDVPSRDHFEAQWMETPKFNTGDGAVAFQAAMTWPYTPSMRWEVLKMIRAATKLPIVAKGITTGEDARMAVKSGADAISVSNHGGRTLDGAIATLHALPEVVDAVGPNIPVIVDGGVRRGGDIVKATALGARAVMIGRPYLWALAAFGQEGVQRSIEMLHGELLTALALSGGATMKGVDRSMIRSAWKPYEPATARRG